ncbi:MAG: 4-(cytidine 5'-diphospho)-2-C-methyl-D-erythritol kinase [Wolinella sp.]
MNSPAKINLFLKITGVRGDYHELASRFWRIDSLFDELFWIDGCDGFFIDSTVSCEFKKNSVYRAKEALMPYLNDRQSRELERLGVRIIKHIPEGAGLGGGSSNAATFLLMACERLGLVLATEELANIGAKVGADVPFFVYGYKSANVRGIGEIVDEFCEFPSKVELFTPPLHIDTATVYRTFRSQILPGLDFKKQSDEAERLLECDGARIVFDSLSRENDLLHFDAHGFDSACAVASNLLGRGFTNKEVGLKKASDSLCESELDAISRFANSSCVNVGFIGESARVYFDDLEKLEVQKIQNMSAVALNDLYPAALLAYSELVEFARNGWFFSGSGSTFFRLAEVVHG